MQVINLEQAFTQVPETWRSRIAGEINDMQVKLARLHGEFVWHQHMAEDELFLVLRGTLTIRLHEGALTIRPGEFAIIPRGVEHLPGAPDANYGRWTMPVIAVEAPNLPHSWYVTAAKRTG